jgi:16S rRNA pseudouridine516 synthase
VAKDSRREFADVPKLDKLLARNLGCSRAQARRLLGDRPEAGLDLRDDALPFPFAIDGKTVQLHDEFHLMLNKPAGCVTALRDPQHITAVSYLRSAPLLGELRPIGRLDLDTTGLLLWTTDGALVHRLTHPRSAIPRTYHVALARGFAAPTGQLVLRDGHRPNLIDLHQAEETAMHPSLLRSPSATAFASITLADGAYHEVRRIFAALGSHVVALCRVSFGAVALPRELGSGQWQALARSAMAPAST